MNKPPVWFTVVAVVALLWNLLGCIAFGADLALTDADVARLPESQQALYNARPAWAVAGTAVAVIGGALGCLALLLRRRWAMPLLLASLAGLLVQDVAMFVLVDGAALAGSAVLAMQGVVLLVAIGLVLLARHARSRGWLR